MDTATSDIRTVEFTPGSDGDSPVDLDSIPPAVREAFAAMQAKVAALEAHTERQD